VKPFVNLQRFIFGRDERGPGRDRTESGLQAISARSGLDRTAIFWRLADQDWIGLRQFLLFLWAYSSHMKTF